MKWVSILRTHILAVSLSYDYLEFVAANEHERTELKLQYPKEKRLVCTRNSLWRKTTKFAGINPSVTTTVQLQY